MKKTKLSEEFIWYHISVYQKLSEEFIREFKDKVSWYHISQYQKLSEEFIREFKDKVDWYCISRYQKLSENFIKEFKNKVNWSNIYKHQKLSEKFIIKYKDKVSLTNIPCISLLANQIARANGYGYATKIIIDNTLPIGTGKIIKHIKYGYRKNTTGEYVPKAYLSNFGWKNTYYQHAETVVAINPIRWGKK